MGRDFILGVIGDFSRAAGVAPDAFVDVDRDEWGEVFARHAPQLSLGLPFCDELTLRDWDDWRPDALVDRVPSFAALLAARDAVSEPPRVRALLEEAGVDLSGVAEPRVAPPGAEPVSESGLLDDILAGKTRGDPVRLSRARTDPAFERMLQEIAAPHAERIDHARIQSWRDAIDGEIGARLRTLLHHPELQRVEAAWRSLRALVWRSETGEDLRIRLLDLSAEALDVPDPGAGTLHRLVVEQERGTFGGQPFSLLVADYEIGARDEDLARLGHLARIATDAAVPCVAGAAPSLWREEGAKDALAFLDRARALPGADRIGLCAPRVLVRIPYGRAADPVDRFAFEEVDADTGPSGYLWGNAAYVVATAAAEAFAATGRASDIPRFAQRESLPFHPQGRAGDPVGPTEQLLPDRELERLRASGLIPLAGVRGRDTAIVLAFESLTGDPLFR